MTTYSKVIARVRAGIAYLDATEGRRDTKRVWLNKINLNRLDLSDDKSCILGQVDGDYSAGKAKRGLKLSWPLGFNIGADGTFPLLTRLWKTEIRKLRRKGG